MICWFEAYSVALVKISYFDMHMCKMDSTAKRRLQLRPSADQVFIRDCAIRLPNNLVIPPCIVVDINNAASPGARTSADEFLIDSKVV